MNDWNRVDQIFIQGLCDPDCEYLCRGYETDYGHWNNCLLFDMTGTDPEFCPVFSEVNLWEGDEP